MSHVTFPHTTLTRDAFTHVTHTQNSDTHTHNHTQLSHTHNSSKSGYVTHNSSHTTTLSHLTFAYDSCTHASFAFTTLRLHVLSLLRMVFLCFPFISIINHFIQDEILVDPGATAIGRLGQAREILGVSRESRGATAAHSSPQSDFLGSIQNTRTS